MSLKAAVIGLGNISGAHIKGWQGTDGVELIAGADVRQEAADRVKESHGIATYTDWRRMLDEQSPDIVSICTPPAFHEEAAVDALGRGMHVMCEKPMAATVADAEAMAAAAEGAAAVIMVAFCHRFHGTAMRAKQLIDEGILGKPVYFRGAFTGKADMVGNHRAQMSLAGGGSLMDNGSHAADLYQFLLGKVANVSCRAGTFLQDMETDDVAVMIFEGENGCFGEIITGYSMPGDFTQWRIVGEKGVLEIVDYFSGPVRFTSAETGEATDYEADNSETRFDRQFRHFVECVKSGTQPISNAQTALHTQRVIDAAYRAAEAKDISI